MDRTNPPEPDRGPQGAGAHPLRFPRRSRGAFRREARVRIRPGDFVGRGRPGMQEQAVGPLEMLRSRKDVAAGDVVAILAPADMLGIADEEHLHHEHPVYPHRRRFVAMPELPVAARIPLDGGQDLRRSRPVFLIPGPAIERAEGGAGHEVVQVGQGSTSIVAVPVHEMVDVVSDIVQETAVTGSVV